MADGKRKTRGNVGPRGVPGPPGPRGPSGTTGAAGKIGPRGPVGKHGARGATGNEPPDRSALLAQVHASIEEIHRDLSIQLTRMAQIQQQVDQLRANLKQLIGV